jgi:glucokinase
MAAPTSESLDGITVGVDLGGTKIQTVAVHGGEVVGSDRVLTPGTGADAVIATIVASVEASLAAASAVPGDVTGIGIGSPGRIDADRGVVSHSPNVPGFADEVALGPAVSQRLDGARVHLGNDVTVAMLGEHLHGAAQGLTDVLGVFVGTGVGGGLVLDGSLRTGRGAAGEIGHTLVEPGGRRCSCGQRGHLEAYAGRAQMEARARRLVQKGHRTDLFHLMRKKGRTRLSSGVWAKALERGDAMAVELVDDAVRALGIALSSAQNLLDMEAIVVGGGLGDRLGQPFVDRIREAMTPRLFVAAHPPALLTTGLGDLGGAIGAAELARR